VLSGDTCFLFDVDNTLLDNDRFGADLGARLEDDFGAGERERYWHIFTRRRDELGYADYLGSLQLFRDDLHDHPRLLGMSEFLLEYPFPRLLYPAALAALARAGTLGRAAVLSDGDIVFQPRKIYRSGIWDTVDGRVLVYIHKERSLANLQERYPASHYVMVDDKANLLAATKLVLGSKVTTVFVRQGHYASAAASLSAQPAPDLTVDHIGDLVHRQLSDFEVSS
jgi:FMN phosphatase YigB (HAD superfamily)